MLVVLTLGVAQLFRLEDDTDHLQTSMPDALVAVKYERDVRPILDRRCVVCHGCYDAPCQLKLSSSEGIARGASKEAVYDSSRLMAMNPTRLFVDATSVEAWRQKGFSSVTDAGPGAASLLKGMLELGRNHPVVADTPLRGTLGLDINRELSLVVSSFNTCNGLAKYLSPKLRTPLNDSTA